MIFSRQEYKNVVKVLPVELIGAVHKERDMQRESLFILSSMTKHRVRM